jgi:hypothetical protein
MSHILHFDTYLMSINHLKVSDLTSLFASNFTENLLSFVLTQSPLNSSPAA